MKSEFFASSISDRYAPSAGFSAFHPVVFDMVAANPPIHADAVVRAKFDDITLTDGVGEVSDGYAGLNWNAFFAENPAVALAGFPDNTGYHNGVVSGQNAAYNGNGVDATVFSAGDFDFNSVYLTSGWRTGMSITVSGYDDGVLEYTQTVVVDYTAPTLFNFNFLDVDTVVFHAFGGTAVPELGGDGTFLVADNFTFNITPGTISGVLYNDLNGDGDKDSGEKGLKNRTVILDDNGNGVVDAGEVTAITNKNGQYTFSNVVIGEHTVTQVLPDYWRQTSPFTIDYDYTFKTSDNNNGPAYHFVDISTTGTGVTLGDDAAVEIALPINFSFFGEVQTSLFISSNGLISFGGANTAYANTALPDGVASGGIIAGLWDDLNPSAGGEIDYFATEDSFIIQYTNVPKYGVTGSVNTFQIILHDDNTIELQYKKITDSGSSASVGVENFDGSDGTQFAFNETLLHNKMAILFTPTGTEVTTPATVIVDSGSGTTHVDFGSHDVSDITGGITGSLWADWNGNGLQNSSEPDLAGFTVYIDTDNDGHLGSGEVSTISDSHGDYHFATLDPGSYTVRVQAPVGTWENWEQTTPATSTTVAATPTTDAAPGTIKPTPGAGTHDGGAPIAVDLNADRVEGQVIVKLKNPGDISTSTLNQLDALRGELGIETVSATKHLGIELWNVNVATPEAIAKLMATGLFQYVEPNYVLTASDLGTDSPSPTPNDPGFVGGDLYGLDKIDAPDAWNITTGSASVIVGSIDTGVDYTHPDLMNNIWTNIGEIAGDGIDNDGNGYIDDIHGYDFVNNDGDAMDDNGHGSHTSGTIGAEGNNGIGVTGVSQDVSIMALKFLDADGFGDTMGAILAVEYATMMGADLTNNSWGGGAFSQALYDAIAEGPLFVAAAGNNASSALHYPAGYDLDNIISVAATDSSDQLADFSNYGSWVDLAAPGVDVVSTVPGGYASLSGTSMAAPHVAGVAALLLAANPDLTADEIVAAILGSVDLVPGLTGDVTTGGRLNAYGALLSLLPIYEGITIDVEAGVISTGNDFGFAGGATSAANVIIGTSHADVINALGGADKITGGGGDDTLTGGADADTFIFAGDETGDDTIADFTRSQGDKIRFGIDGVSAFSDLTIATVTGGSLVTWGTDSSILVQGSTVLRASDFRFVPASSAAALGLDTGTARQAMLADWAADAAFKGGNHHIFDYSSSMVQYDTLHW